MSVKIIRKKDWLNTSYSSLEVFMDGQQVATIYGNDSCTVELENASAELKVKQPLSKSAKKTVRNGDVVEVSNSPLIRAALYLLPVLLILTFIFANTGEVDIFVLIGLAAAYITFILSIKPLKIEVVDT